MALLKVEIEAESSHSELADLLHGISRAVDDSGVEANFTASITNQPLVATETTVPPPDEGRVRLSDLLGETSTANQRKAVTVLEKYAGVIWLGQLMELSEQDVLDVHYFGTILLPRLKYLLNEHGYVWPTTQ